MTPGVRKACAERRDVLLRNIDSVQKQIEASERVSAERRKYVETMQKEVAEISEFLGDQAEAAE